MVQETKTKELRQQPRNQRPTTQNQLAMKVKAETLRNSQQQEDCYVHDKNSTTQTKEQELSSTSNATH